MENPFTPEAKFNYEKFEKYVRLATRMLDDIVDIELEKVQGIIDKVNSDPEEEVVKRVEKELWERIYKKGEMGRRLGLGPVGIGDCLAAMGITYGTDEATDMIERLQSFMSCVAYMESMDLAVERGSFPIFNYEKESTNPFILNIFDGIKSHFGEDVYNSYIEKWKTTGRRNIACLTAAPTGSVSLESQVSSGIEPVFAIYYSRKRKTNAGETPTEYDDEGIGFVRYNVLHYPFIQWYATRENIEFMDAKSILESMNSDDLDKLISESPYHNATAHFINPVKKAQMQGRMQKWIDNSISCTVNMPKDATEEQVNKVYIESYRSGCKGSTIYRDTCRDGVLTVPAKSSEKSTVDEFKNITERPEVLEAEVVRFRNGDELWIAYVGILNGRPYEIFTGMEDKEEQVLPRSVKTGKIIKVVQKGKKRYDFTYTDKYGYTNTIGGISHMFRKEYWNYARLISGFLRNDVPIENILDALEPLSMDKETINTWKAGVMRALKKFVKNGAKSKSACPECGSRLVFQEGCLVCPGCGHSKCG